MHLLLQTSEAAAVVTPDTLWAVRACSGCARRVRGLRVLSR